MSVKLKLQYTCAQTGVVNLVIVMEESWVWIQDLAKENNRKTKEIKKISGKNKEKKEKPELQR